MARAKRTRSSSISTSANLGATVDELRLAALEQGDPLKTGRHLLTFKEGATAAGVKALTRRRGLRMATTADFTDHAVRFEEVADSDAFVFSEIGVALVSGAVAAEHDVAAATFAAEEDAVHSVDPEYFMFANAVNPSDYLRGFLRATQTIRADLIDPAPLAEELLQPEAVGMTWGLTVCKVPPSAMSANGIRIAVLDTGFDLGHPDFAGRAITSHTFVGQPVQDLHGHGTHTAGTACGPKAPAGAIQRYGIGYQSAMFIGKVLSNSGGGTQAQVLAGMNWAIVNKCAVISLSLGAPIPVQPSYTAAGTAALNAGCLIIAAAGNDSSRPAMIKPAGAPANSPTVVSVAAMDASLQVAPFSNGGKVDIAAPGVNVFSSWPRPKLHNTISGTSMATPHVTGCAALWAQTSKSLRGAALRSKLLSSARRLSLPASDVGAGLVQAP
ncbi:MAG TPA: S8 family serine peptidase [Steroidobacteraceae bacterium]|nr:S8 family serine peptidase [Steroidobacteraceae bacterium]